MSRTDPLTTEQVENLARRQRDGDRISKNEAWEVSEAIRVGNGDVEKIRDGRVT